MSVQPVRSEERLSRYLIERSKFGAGRVKYTAFMPPANCKLSVYRSSQLEEGEIWAIGRDLVAKPLGKTLYGRGDLLAQEVLSQALRVEPDPTPRPEHANIEGWPAEDPEKVRQIALQLAAVSKLELVPGADEQAGPTESA